MRGLDELLAVTGEVRGHAFHDEPEDVRARGVGGGEANQSSRTRQEIFAIEHRIMSERDRFVAGVRGKLNPHLKKQYQLTHDPLDGRIDNTAI